ncbi:hypothetical protein PIIN_08484 [Serendipita indica DSM 11827]|uniref:Uncharacterized protein n=1 Tax=Serendipita indica (strain DSM 11827) TaxID=1109443 RepID=G4TT89_SERID|nr:hypothetical protein PIIN_08484 [Serendipita indica DSM 11827]
MRLFATPSSSSRTATARDVDADQNSPVRSAQQHLQQPLLDRHASQLSYGSLVDHRPSSERRARSRRRKARLRTSVYADPPPSYRRALLSYTLAVTIPSTLILLLLGLLKILVWPRTVHPSPLREFGLAAGSYVVSYALRIPILYISTLCNTYFNSWTMALSTFLHVSAQEAIRLAMLVVLQIHLERPSEESLLRGGDGGTPLDDWAPLPDVWDAAFTQVWWLALGWATMDVAVGIVQGYEQLALYRDAWSHHHHRPHLRHDSHGPVTDSTSSPSPPPHGKHRRSSTANERRESTSAVEDAHPALKRPASHIVYTLTPQHVSSADLTATYEGAQEGQEAEPLQESTILIAAPMDLEAELSHLLVRKQRAELEGVYGSPLPRIPVFLIALQRFDSILLSVGLTLLVSAAYLRAFYLPATTVVDDPNLLKVLLSATYQQDWAVDWSKVKDTTVPIICAAVLVHFFLSMLWIEALPRIGVHTASYVGLLVSLAVLFAGLGCWGALI